PGCSSRPRRQFAASCTLFGSGGRAGASVDSGATELAVVLDRARDRKHRARLLLLAGTALIAIVVAPAPARAAGAAPIRHIWVINEENGQVCKNRNDSIYSLTFPGLK